LSIYRTYTTTNLKPIRLSSSSPHDLRPRRRRRRRSPEMDTGRVHPWVESGWVGKFYVLRGSGWIRSNVKNI